MNTENTTIATTTDATNVNVRRVGRPNAELVFPENIFTVDSLYELNRGPRGKGKKAKICKLTVRKHIEAKLELGYLTKLESLKTGKPGQPASRFIRTDLVGTLNTNVAATTNTNAEAVAVATEEAPVNEEPVAV